MNTICETFVGCGGSHFGFKKAGFKSIFVNDVWKDALETLKKNDKDIQENQVIHCDINDLNEACLKKHNITNYKDVDVLIGGVVCKGFSLAGIRNPLDERNYLYLQQLRLVNFIKPKISIIENVPQMKTMKILNANKKTEVEETCSILNKICNDQKTVRGKLINLKKQCSKINDLIEKNVSNNDKLHKDLDKINSQITITNNKLKQLKGDRKIREKELDKYKYSVIDDIVEQYQKIGYTVQKKDILTCSHYGCATNRRRLFIVAVRNDLNIEWEYPDQITMNNKPTVRDALDMLDLDNINNPKNDKDNRPMNHRASTVEKFKKVKSDQKSKDSYFSRGTSSRLSWDKPAPTLVPGHSSFQIHPEEHRSITVREGAIITGFDRDFEFCGSHSSRCMQIGNAIPVNMAYHLAEQCKKILATIK